MLPKVLRADAGVAIAAGFVTVVGLSIAAQALLGLGAAYPFKASAAFLLPMLVAAAFLADHHPFSRFGLGNQVTTARAALIALVAGAVGEPTLPTVAAGVVATALVATALDGLDGLLARRSGMSSAFGARLDMELDAFLIMAMAILCWQFGKAGPWVLWSGLLRYMFVVGGWASAWLRQPLPYSRRRQAVCVIQVAGLMLVMAPWITPPLSTALAALALVILAGSFAVDVVWLWRNADQSARAPYGAPSLGHRR